ncbi:PucR family transcriptional regulator [Rhizobium sp. C1]|jgi:purine catabolism regulator|uniref:PucR family transcriptional regulator n=1 Tax=Rhizobium sp. C1 TaxID=1349799 RepID=UPI001E48A11D|nr:PucR family transcriptional regulator [Rhizobium sp. C1]MCD2180324.1 PucR family transcriptional regulator ligand-binding domain-containing protein [Rhizobium sp. C1]
MPLRIMDIINTPELRSRVVSGEQGLDRIVRWAHVCELADPTKWLGDGDLLMTTGIGIPADPGAQSRYVESLAKAGLAGMMIGENMQAPSDLEALRKTAEQLGFPLLLTHYGVPFASVTKAVVDATRLEEFERRNAIARVCISARMAIEGLDLEALLRRLEKDVHADLYLWDPQAQELWLPRQVELPEKLREALCQQKPDSQDSQLVVRRHALEDGEVLAISIPSRRGYVMLARRAGQDYLDYSLVNYMSAVLGIALERLHVESERALRAGSELMDDLLNARLSPRQATKRLESFNIELETAHLAVTARGRLQFAEWALLFERLDAPFLLSPQGDELLLLLPAESAQAIQDALGSPMGLSDPIDQTDRLTEAIREARLALAHTNPGQLVVLHERVVDRLPWLPQNLDEATQTFRHVLGNLADHDEESRASLLYTLKIFLEQNRSWQSTAEKLHIHKTSLTYRVRRIEALTERSLNSTADVTALWLALQAGEILGLAQMREKRG